MITREQQIKAIETEWKNHSRWKDVERGYSAADVVRLRGSVQPEYTYARNGAEKLWELVHGGASKGYVNCMGAITAGQAMQQAKAYIAGIIDIDKDPALLRFKGGVIGKIGKYILPNSAVTFIAI